MLANTYFNPEFKDFYKTVRSIDYRASLRFEADTLKRFIFISEYNISYRQYEEGNIIIEATNYTINKNPLTINDKYQIISQQFLKENSILLVSNKGERIAQTYIKPKSVLIYNNITKQIHQLHDTKLELDKDLNITNKNLTVDIYTPNTKQRKKNQKQIQDNLATDKVILLVDTIDYEAVVRELPDTRNFEFDPDKTNLNTFINVLNIASSTDRAKLLSRLENISTTPLHPTKHIAINNYGIYHQEYLNKLKTVRDKSTIPYMLTKKQYEKNQL